MNEPTKYDPKVIAKIIALLGFVLLVLIVTLQNTEEVETKLLFVTMNMPRALLLFLNLMIGYILGLVTMIILKRRAGRTKKLHDSTKGN